MVPHPHALVGQYFEPHIKFHLPQGGTVGTLACHPLQEPGVQGHWRGCYSWQEEPDLPHLQLPMVVHQVCHAAYSQFKMLAAELSRSKRNLGVSSAADVHVRCTLQQQKSLLNLGQLQWQEALSEHEQLAFILRDYLFSFLAFWSVSLSGLKTPLQMLLVSSDCSVAGSWLSWLEYVSHQQSLGSFPCIHNQILY